MEKNHHHQFRLPDSETTITFVYLPSLNLYVISDAKGFGQNWVQVTYFQKVYDSKLLLGSDMDDRITSMARHFAQPIIAKKLSQINDPLIAMDEIRIHFNISLRDPPNAKTVQIIRQEFEKYFIQDG